MTSNDLFSFLDNDNDSENSDSETAMQVDSVPGSELAPTPTPSNKRSLDSEPQTRVKSPPPSPREDGPPSKRKRLEDAPAVVVDEFETEAKREVAASAGLTGAAETAGSRLELRYQVSRWRSFLESSADCQTPGSTSSCRTTRLSLCSYRFPCSPSKACARVQVHLGSLSTSRHPRHPTK
jgi:hypothetical protein